MQPRTTLGLFAAFAALGAWAHPGGLDPQGGHTNHKTGIYHFHRGTNAPSHVPPKSNATSLVASNAEAENRAREATGAEADEPSVLYRSGAVLKQIPWWVYLTILGGGYATWEIGYYFSQKKKGKE